MLYHLETENEKSSCATSTLWINSTNAIDSSNSLRDCARDHFRLFPHHTRLPPSTHVSTAPRAAAAHITRLCPRPARPLTRAALSVGCTRSCGANNPSPVQYRVTSQVTHSWSPLPLSPVTRGEASLAEKGREATGPRSSRPLCMRARKEVVGHFSNIIGAWMRARWQMGGDLLVQCNEFC